MTTSSSTQTPAPASSTGYDLTPLSTTERDRLAAKLSQARKITVTRQDTTLVIARRDDGVWGVADRGDYVLPWTAFWVEHTHQRDKRERAYRAFWEARKG